MPRAFNKELANIFDGLLPLSQRMVHENDIVSETDRVIAADHNIGSTRSIHRLGVLAC